MRPSKILLISAIVLAPTFAFAQPPEGEEPTQTMDDNTELSKQLQNPVSDLVSIPVQVNFDSGGELTDRSQVVTNVQPVIPIKVWDDYKIISRTTIPYVSVPVLSASNDSGLADIQEQVFFTPAAWHGLTWGAGPAFSFPTATVDSVKTGSWGIGPAAVASYTTTHWVLGGQVQQVFPVADYGDSRKLNQLTMQPFANYNFGSGWAVIAAPQVTANWTGANDWIIPVGGGISWTGRIGSQAVNLSTQYYYNLERAEVGGRNELRLQFAFLFPSKKPARAATAVALASTSH